MTTQTLEPDVITGASTIEGIDLGAEIPCDIHEECHAPATHLVKQWCGCGSPGCWHCAVLIKAESKRWVDEGGGWTCAMCFKSTVVGEYPIVDVVRL